MHFALREINKAIISLFTSLWIVWVGISLIETLLVGYIQLKQNGSLWTPFKQDVTNSFSPFLASLITLIIIILNFTLSFVMRKERKYNLLLTIFSIVLLVVLNFLLYPIFNNFVIKINS